MLHILIFSTDMVRLEQKQEPNSLPYGEFFIVLTGSDFRRSTFLETPKLSLIRLMGMARCTLHLLTMGYKIIQSLFLCCSVGRPATQLGRNTVYPRPTTLPGSPHLFHYRCNCVHCHGLPCTLSLGDAVVLAHSTHEPRYIFVQTSSISASPFNQPTAPSSWAAPPNLQPSLLSDLWPFQTS